MKEYNVWVIIWKNNIPKVANFFVKIKNEKHYETMLMEAARKKADENKLEVSIALYKGKRHIFSYRALPGASIGP